MGAAFARPDRTDGTASVPPTSGLSSKFAAGHPEARLYHSREGDQGLGRGEYGIRGQSRLASILCPPLDLAGTVGEFKLLSEPMRGVATTVHELDESHKRCAPLRTDINMTVIANILRLLQRVKERIDAGDEGLLLAMMDCNTDIQISGLDRHCQSLLELLSWLEEEPCGTLQAGPGLQRALIRKRLDLLKALYEFLRDKGALTADDAVLRILRGTVPHGRQDLIEAEAARAAELAQKSKARSKALSLGQSTSAVSRKTLADMVEEHSGLPVEQWLFWTERYLDRIEEDIKILAEGRGSMKLSAEGFDALVIWGVIVDGEYVAPEGPVLRYVELRRDWLRSDRRYLQALLHARDNSPAANSAAASEDTRPT